jgi:hypothetical protein
MNSVRKLVLVVLGVLALHGMQACSTETELNPQPLPPTDPGEGNEGKRGPESDQAGGFGGSTGAPPPNATGDDAGAEGGNKDGGEG